MSENGGPARIGFVGLGVMGKNHAKNVDDLGHDVVAGVDPDPEARDRFGSHFAVETYTGPADLYASEPLDAVVITAPNKYHEPAATPALERGIDVFCEKPLAHTLDSAERIAAAAQASEGFCMVGFNNRFATAPTLFEEYRDAGRFGEITHVQANYVRRRGIPGVGSWFTNEAVSGGGSLVDLGVHVVDLALFALGFPEVEEVTGVTRSQFGGRSDYADPDDWGGNWSDESGVFDVDDSVSAFVRCADDRTISLETSWAAEQRETTEFVIRGTEAGAQFDLHEDSLQIVDTGTRGTDHFFDAELSGSRSPEGYEAELQTFAKATVAGEPPEVNTVEEGLAVQRVIDAIYRSSETGRAQRL